MLRGLVASLTGSLPFEDDDARRAAQLLRLVNVICLLGIVGYALVTIDSAVALPKRWPLGAAFLVALGSEWGLRRGFVRPQSWVIVFGLALLALMGEVTSGGLRAPATLTLFVAVTLAGILLGSLGAVVIAAVSSACATYVYFGYATGRLHASIMHSERQYAGSLAVQLLACGGLIGISAWSLSTTLKRLRREQEVSRNLVEDAPDAMASVDLQGRMLRVNRAHERLLGLGRAQVVGHSFTEFASLLEPHLAEAEEKFRQAALGEGPVLFEFGLSRPDGTKVIVESNAQRVQRPDGTFAIDFVMRDVTARVLAEQREQALEKQLRAARKLEAIGQLAGGVAHDFNNLLTVVLGNLQLLQYSKLRPDQQELVKEIEGAAHRATAITSQLLAIGRRQPSQPRSLSMNEVLTALGPVLRRMVPASVEIVQRFAPDLPNVSADPGQVEQVVLNLVANARDAMPFQGQLFIETFATTLTEPDPAVPMNAGTFATLRVRDTGVGMTDETRLRVFEPFFTTKGTAAGTGLGLATVYGIVKQSGGHISVESTADVGSSFTVYLPARAQGIAAIAAPRASSGRKVSSTLLLVDDDVAVRRVLSTVLREAGHEVLVAEGGRQALEFGEDRGRDIDLLISDVVMPEMSGIEIATKLRARFPDLRVLLLSGYGDTELPPLLGGVTPAHFLTKPVSPSELLAKVAELLK